MDVTNYKTAAMADLSRISQINAHLDSDEDFTGVVEVLDQSLEIGEVGDAMADLNEKGLVFGPKDDDSVNLRKMRDWIIAGKISAQIGNLITENHPDEYVYVIALPPFYLIKRKAPAAQVEPEV